MNAIDIDFRQFIELQNTENAIIVDVRDMWEFEEFNVGGLNIPLHELPDQIQQLSEYDHILLVCANGVRSKIAARILIKNDNIREANVYHLKEGLVNIE